MTDDINLNDNYMDDLPYSYNNRAITDFIKEQVKIHAQCVNILNQRLLVSKSSPKSFDSFHSFQYITPLFQENYSKSFPTHSLNISFIDYETTFFQRKTWKTFIDRYVIGHLKVNKTYPTTYIVEESLSDKIANVFTNQDLNFDQYKNFSKTFKVLTNDKDKLRSMLESKSLDLLADFPDMEIELYNNEIYFRSSRKSISLEEVQKFCELTKVVIEVFS